MLVPTKCSSKVINSNPTTLPKTEILKVSNFGKRNLFLQLCSDWCNSARGQRDRGSQGDHCQVVLQGLFVEVGVDRHPLDLPLDALALVAGRVLVQDNVNLSNQ